MGLDVVAEYNLRWFWADVNLSNQEQIERQGQCT